MKELYRPFKITAFLSVIGSISFFIGLRVNNYFSDIMLAPFLLLVYFGIILAIIILSIRDYKKIYAPRVVAKNLILVVVSTPLPLILFGVVLNYLYSFNSLSMMSKSITPLNGCTVKEVVYGDNSGKKAVIKYYKINTVHWPENELGFYKDSVWVYFDEDGDTSKLEYYKNGILIKTKLKQIRW